MKKNRVRLHAMSVRLQKLFPLVFLQMGDIVCNIIRFLTKMTNIPVREARTGGIEHVILPRGCTYVMGSMCSVQKWELDAWPGDFHMLISHSNNCDCESRGEIFPSAFDSAKRVQQVQPPLAPSEKK